MAITKVSTTVIEQTANHLKLSGDTSRQDEDSSASISSVLKGASSLASTITGKQEGGEGIVIDEADKYGLSSSIESFNIVEICSKYTERLKKEVSSAGEQVFSIPEETDKIKLCLEDFEAVKNAYAQVLRTGFSQLVNSLQQVTFCIGYLDIFVPENCNNLFVPPPQIISQPIKDLISFTLGRQGMMGGLKLDLDDEAFDLQPTVPMLPKALVNPIENMVEICTNTMTDANKNEIVGLLANLCCEKLEHFINLSSFGFAGALKIEECFRALSNMFSRHSTIPIRGKFSRLREICQVLTADVSGGIASVAVDTFSYLTASEVQAFLVLRVDAHTDM